MNKIKIVCDSTTDLNDELKEYLDCLVLPLSVNFDEESYLDGVDITTTELYDKVSERKKLPKTNAISLGVFIDSFSKLLEIGYDVIFMGISKQMSRTYENAFLAAKELDESRIKVIDSMNLSTGTALLLLKIKKYIDKCYTLDEIEEKINEDRLKVRSQFAIPTMEYLYKGGRCSSLTSIVATIAKIKPIILVRNGAMSVGKKPHGKMKVALDTLLNMLKEDLDNVSNEDLFITHSLSLDDAKYLEEKVREMLPTINIHTTEAGCVISSHCGKGTIGILYMVK